MQGEPLRIIGYTIVPNEECKELHQTISAGWGLAARIAMLEEALRKLVDWAADADLTIYNEFSSSDHHDEAEEITEARAALADAPGGGQ